MTKHDEFVSEAVRTVEMGHADIWGYFDDLIQRIEASVEAEKPLTDHDLLKVAEEWHNELPTHFIGLKTAFTHGYRTAERKLLPTPYQPEGREYCQCTNEDVTLLEHLTVCRKCFKQIQPEGREQP